MVDSSADVDDLDDSCRRIMTAWLIVVLANRNLVDLTVIVLMLRCC